MGPVVRRPGHFSPVSTVVYNLTAVFFPLNARRRAMNKLKVRYKAMSDRYPRDGPASIPTAYTELTRQAFAVWLRLMVEPRDTLKIGRKKLARVLSYTERRSNAILRELAHKGYVSFLPNGPGQPTEVIIERRALISVRDGFVRLSNLLSESEGEGSGVIVVEAKNSTNLTPVYLPTASVRVTHGRGLVTHGKSLVTHGHRSELPTAEGQNPKTADLSTTMPRCDSEIRNKKHSPPELLASSSHPKPIKRRKFTSLGKYVPTTSSPTSREDIRERFKKKYDQEKTKRKAERSEAERRHSNRHKARGTTPGSIDWLRLDQRGEPAVSFEPTTTERKRLVEVLNRKPRDSERKRLMSKIATEFGRIYTRYRRQAERRLGRSYSEYEVLPDERKYAAEAGLWCIQKYVTPRQVLEYWDSHIKDFADGSMALPPLSFLRWPANIDRVACSVLSKGEKRRSAHPRGSSAASAKPSGGSSFSELDGLDVNLRPSLNAAGFDTQAYNDRYLLGVQFNAFAIAEGRRIFMGESRAKQMAVWAARELYAK